MTVCFWNVPCGRRNYSYKYSCMRKISILLLKKLWAFSFLELIVVIMIVSILSTIGFISLQGFQWKSRDAVRIADMNSIVKIMGMNYIKTGSYPEPWSGIEISYLGSVLWKQGYFDESVRQVTQQISQVPLEPLGWGPYVYSVTYNKKEFQIAWVIEGGEPISLHPQASASFSRSIVKGSYNGVILGKMIDNNMHIFWVPSLITKSTNSLNITDLVSNKLFVLNDYAALPPSFATTAEEAGRIVDFTPNNINDVLVFSGSLSELATDAGLVSIENNLRNLYTNTGVNEHPPVKNYISSSEVPNDIRKMAINLYHNKSVGPEIGNALREFYTK